MDHKIAVDEWAGCYPSNWKGMIVPDAIAHPAKFSSKLIRRIYEHMREEDWIPEGSTIIDPFGGVALGSLDAQRLGLCWRGVELEPRFADLGNANIAEWNRRFSRMPGWSVDAHLFNGDSRELVKVLKEAGALDPRSAVSSPPYAGTPIVSFTDDKERTKEINRQLKKQGYIEWQGKRYSEVEWRAMNHGRIDGRTTRGAKKGAIGYSAATISSPPYAESIGNAEQSGIDWSKQADRETTHPHGWNGAGYSAVVTSPPYADSMEKPNGIDRDKIKSTAGPNSQALQDTRYSAPAAPSAVISSPPYADGCAHTGGDTPTSQDHIEGGTINLPGIRGVVSSPPYSETRIGQESGQESCGPGDQYSSTPGQLGSMKANGFEAAISSPPWGKMEEGQGIAAALRGEETRSTLPNNHSGPNQGYQASVSSPPFRQTSGGTNENNPLGRGDPGLIRRHAAGNAAAKAYGSTDGQLANTTDDDFWMAARRILDQVYQVLEPGAHAVWVVKSFVKNKARVDFPNQWRQVCEAAGFITLHEHHALLIRDKGTSHTLEGGTVHHQTETKSFFRRLAENKGSPRIDWEVVYCMVKP